MKHMLNEPFKRFGVFLINLFDHSAENEQIEFEREFSSSQRTAHIRTWEYRNDRF